MRFSSSLCLVYLATAEGVGSGETRTCQLAVGDGGPLPFGEGYLDLRVEIAVTKSRDCERGTVLFGRSIGETELWDKAEGFSPVRDLLKATSPPPSYALPLHVTLRPLTSCSVVLSVTK
ncbi:unnamed protein product [Vitrella brassicaformis CCMP3155]|uniref:Uncharacterized protein n=1 Tax=Vitrella brassicaformis (strain CCMP3155) TaxID=1169540 RepID=A0A0G4GFM3_VITBC|nr:unnamed protein product [Vitrella brassicaformis CCMP3155]|eukprot:CEM28312.1 unnamed protein product [Vitrella brassicaformis CCMP3155]